jgi:hypothetical protein
VSIIPTGAAHEIWKGDPKKYFNFSKMVIHKLSENN